ncbi:hypothetical protein ScPMuIL_008228 [Solemya velum]
MDFTENDECWISGWGVTNSESQREEILQELKIDITPYEDCEIAWGSSIREDSHVCVGMGDVGACNGDSGGPLSCVRGDDFFIVGATSWGRSGCETPNYPNVYTKISHFHDWIVSQMLDN